MDYRVDEKGKTYTTRMTKQTVRTVAVTIATLTDLIRGVVYLTLDNRIKDELNSGERFIAVTQAEVFDHSGQTPLGHHSVLILNKDQLIWISPQEEKQEESTEEVVP